MFGGIFGDFGTLRARQKSVYFTSSKTAACRPERMHLFPPHTHTAPSYHCVTQLNCDFDHRNAKQKKRPAYFWDPAHAFRYTAKPAYVSNSRGIDIFMQKMAIWATWTQSSVSSPPFDPPCALGPVHRFFDRTTENFSNFAPQGRIFFHFCPAGLKKNPLLSCRAEIFPRFGCLAFVLPKGFKNTNSDSGHRFGIRIREFKYSDPTPPNLENFRPCGAKLEIVQ